MVVLIDDDDDFRQALAEGLRDDGYDVRDYPGAESLPPLKSLRDVQLVITDYQMPGKDGLDLADEFHAAHPQAPVVLVTAYYSHHLEAEAAARGFLHLKRKPLDYEELEQLIGQPS